MKKPYVAPASRLFTINLKENIAASDSIYNGDDLITATAVIYFTQDTEPCRGMYTGLVKVDELIGDNASFGAYWSDLNKQVGEGVQDGYLAYYKCFKYVSGT